MAFSREIPEYVAKSTGRMVTVLFGTELPLVRYARGSRVVYTTSSFGPLPGQVYDWERSSPVRFTERQVDKAVSAGLVTRVGTEVRLSRAGHALGLPCSKVWGPEIGEYFKEYTDWRKMR